MLWDYVGFTATLDRIGDVIMTGDRRVALVANAGFYVGPRPCAALPREARPRPRHRRSCARIWSTSSKGSARRCRWSPASQTLPTENAAASSVQAGFDRFGRIDSAVAASGRIVVGRFLKSSVDDLRAGARGLRRGALQLPARRGTADGRAGRRTGARHHQCVRRPAHAWRAAVFVGPRRSDDARAQRRCRSGPERACRSTQWGPTTWTSLSS